MKNFAKYHHDPRVPSYICSETDSHILHLAGYAFIDGTYYSEKEFSRFLQKEFNQFDSNNLVAQTKQLLLKLNGFFSIIYISDHFCLSIVDRVRSRGIFYRKSERQLDISFNPELLIGKRPFEMNQEASVEFLLAGYIPGRHTLHKNILQLNSGQFLVAKRERDKYRIAVEDYYQFFQTDIEKKSDEVLQDELGTIIDKIFHRYYDKLKNKKVIVPLSGGLDSRLIIAMLKKIGINNVLCFSYGKQTSPDTQLSKKLADCLGYDWQFIPYTGSAFWHNLQNNLDFRTYLKFGSALSSIAHPQDWPAIQYLVPKNTVEDSVIIPGHTGDFISGGHIPNDLMKYAKSHSVEYSVAHAIFEHHYDLWPVPKQKKDIKNSIIKNIIQSFITKPSDINSAVKCYEAWEWNGRQSRFIINSLRVYDFFDINWAIPLWDNDLMNFFSRLDVGAKYGKRIYINTLVTKIFSGKLNNLLKIPVSSTTQLHYQEKGPMFQTSLKRNLIDSFLHMEGKPSVITRMIRNYKNDIFGIYGFFGKPNIVSPLFEKTKSVIDVNALNDLPHSVVDIIGPEINNPVAAQSIRSLFSARYLLSLK